MAGNCQIPTPPEYVRHMLDYIGYAKNLYGKTVLENSCGEGNILLEIVTRYIESAKEENRSSDEIKVGLNRDIIAYEIDAGCVKQCKKRLNKLVHSYGLKGINWNIQKKDFLKVSVQGTFDYIIGNPPYITYHDMDEEQRELLKNDFQTCKHGRSDYCYAFMEASIKTLALDGKMAYLVPYSIMTNKFAGELRKYILPYTTEIYDYRTIRIFPEALTSSAIFVCEKPGRQDNFVYHLVAEKQTLDIPKDRLGNKWIILGEQNVHGNRFDKYFEVRNSVATLLNEAFVLTDYEYNDHYYVVGEHKIEEELVRDAVSTKSLNKKNKGKKDKIIFPYCIINGKKTGYAKEEFEERFPFATAYLQQFKEKLDKRKADENANWFEYGRSQAVLKVFGKKLVIPMVVTQKVHAYEADEQSIPYAGYFIKCKEDSPLDLSVAKKILESQAFYDYVKICGTPTTPTSFRISVDDIKDYMIEQG